MSVHPVSLTMSPIPHQRSTLHSHIRSPACLLLLALLTLASLPRAAAFTIDGSKWQGGETEFYVALSGLSGTGIAYDVAFIEALQEWNDRTDFNFVLRKEYHNPCVNDQTNSVDFTDTVCGSAYGENTLAVTLRNWDATLLGPPQIVQGDVVINRKIAYNVYDGNLVQVGIPFGNVDFRRVALHELGHVIGLDHSTAQQSIMRATIGNTFALQQDDIDGVNTLYGGLKACGIGTLRFGRTDDTLQPGDCRVNQLTVGGTDDSFIDIRRLDLSSPTDLVVEMRSSTLDSVLLLADDRLRFLQVDDNGAGGCDARLTLSLQAGTYYVLSNTYDSPVNTTCGNSGSYSLYVSHTGQAAASLGKVVSLQGGTVRAQFSGGVSADNGLSFGNRFKATDSLDITASISVEPLHVGEPGFIVVAAIIDGSLFLLDEKGVFVTYNGVIQPFRKGPLAVVESLVIADDLIPAQLGINTIQMDLLVGYGLDRNPQQVFYHQTPINLVVEP